MDVYSFAFIVWELFVGKKPYEGVKCFEIPNQVLKGVRPSIPDSIPACVVEIIKQCWDQNPRKRPNFDKIKSKIKDLQHKEIQSRVENL